MRRHSYFPFSLPHGSRDPETFLFLEPLLLSTKHSLQAGLSVAPCLSRASLASLSCHSPSLCLKNTQPTAYVQCGYFFFLAAVTSMAAAAAAARLLI